MKARLPILLLLGQKAYFLQLKLLSYLLLWTTLENVQWYRRCLYVKSTEV